MVTSDTAGAPPPRRARGAGPVTAPTAASPHEFVAGVPDPARRRDAETLFALFARATGAQPVMWGSAIVGYGTTRQGSASGAQAWLATGFSPRARALSVYLMDGADARPDLLARLGPHRTGRGCLYLTRLDGIDLAVLEEIVRASYLAVAAPADAGA